MRARIPALFVIGLIVSACGGNKDDNGGSGGSNDVPQIRGGERLAWIQTATSLQQLQSLTYRLYVSGNAATINAVRCSDTVGPSGYDCSGILPPMSVGPHDLELTSILQGIESPRSSRLQVNVIAATGTASSNSSTSTEQGAAAITACAKGGSRSCFAGTGLVARNVTDPAFLTATPDGRVLFAESAARVRVIVNQILMDEPALVLPGSARIVGITLDRDFSTSHAVFIAWTERTRNESEVLNISRYREVANTLGESAVIVTGLPFRSDSVAPVTIGVDGLLYIAVPSGSPTKTPGLVLRFTRDGHIPKDNPNALPVIAAGYARPTGMAIDPIAGRIWIAGESPEWLHNIATLAMFDDQRPRWRVTPADHLASAEQFRSATLAFTYGGNSGGAKLMIATMSRLYEAAIDAGGMMSSVREIVFENNLAVLAVAPGAQDTLYVAVRDVAGSSAIVQMRAQ